MEDMAGWRDVRANLTGREEPREVLVDQTTTNYFALLGAPPLLGRTFTVAAGRRRTESTTVKIPVVAPMPRASVRTQAVVKPGVLRIARRA